MLIINNLNNNNCTFCFSFERQMKSVMLSWLDNRKAERYRSAFSFSALNSLPGAF